MKKLLSIVLALSLIMSLFCVVPASAEVTLPSNIGADYTADASTKLSNNMVTDGANGLYGNSWDGDFTYGLNTNKQITGVASTSYIYFKPSTAVTTAATEPVIGFIVKTTKPTGLSGRVLWSVSMKKDSADATVYLNVDRRNEEVGSSNAAYIEHSVEYGSAGFAPTSGYATYTGTFADTGAASDQYTYEVGCTNGTASGAMSRIDTTKSYIGYEYAYDMTITPDGTNLFAGNKITVETAFVNQMDNAFGGNTDVTWYATTADRTAAVEGFTFTDNEDGTYDVSVASTVAAGTYDIVAVSDANANIVKGIEVTVTKNPYADHVADEANRYSNNMITDGANGLYGNSWDGDFTYGLNTNKQITGVASTSYIYFKPSTAVTTAATESVIGFIVKTTKPTGLSGRVLWSFSMKKDSADATVYLNVDRRNEEVGSSNAAYIEHSVEYGSAGFAPTSGYATYTGTFADTGVASDQYTYEVGCTNGTASGAMSRIDTTKSYIGYEYAYDMTVTADAATVEAGNTVGVSASVINQMGNAYGGTEAITWKAMNTDRTAEIEGITITPGANGTATVAVANTVAAGTYDIVAVLGNAVMAKGTPITVEAAEIEPIVGINIEKTDDGKILVSTDTDLTDAKLIFVTYGANRKMTSATPVNVTLAAQGTQEYAIPAGFETAKVMLWYDMTNCKPLTDVLD